MPITGRLMSCRLGGRVVIDGALRRHVDLDKITEQNLHAELGQIVAGLRPGRQRDGETILFWHRGLGLSDIALGHAMLKKAHAMGVGATLRFA